jgi:ABC-2 type transport system permease protein
MRSIIHIIRKEFLQLRRDRRMLPIIFIAPVIQLIILGYAANLDIKNIRTVVCDMDRTETSRDFVSKFSNSEYFEVNDYVYELKDIDHYLDFGKASFAIVIPRKFGSDLLAGKQPQLQLIFDGSESTYATAGVQYATIIANTYSREIVLKTLARLRDPTLKIPSINPQFRVWYNPDLKSRNFMIPGVLALLLMVMTTLLTALAIVKEKEVGTMEQLIVSPIRPYALIIGKLAPFIIIGMIDIVLVLLVATFVFDVPVKGSVFLLFGLCVVYLMTTLGLGLFVSTISKNQQQAMLGAMFFLMMPMIYLSGFVFPIENMPKAMQYVTYIIPLRYFIIIIRGLFLKGVGMHELWGQALVLFLFGLAILTMSVFRFSKKEG